MGGAYPEGVVTNFVGGAGAVLRLKPPVVSAADGDVTLTWSSVEGGTYVVSAATNAQTWGPSLAPSVTATSNVASATEPSAAAGHATRSYKVTRIGLAPYSN